VDLELKDGKQVVLIRAENQHIIIKEV
jgi:hypothetical protein